MCEVKWLQAMSVACTRAAARRRLSTEYAANPSKVELVDTTAHAYYGKGYQDVQNRVPKITNTCADLDWQPAVGMEDALVRIFDAYRGQVAEARRLVD